MDATTVNGSGRLVGISTCLSEELIDDLLVILLSLTCVSLFRDSAFENL